MSKKSGKYLCWNCEANLPQSCLQCPYCGVDLAKSAPSNAFQIPQPTEALFPSPNEQQIEQEKESEEEFEESTKKTITSLLLLFPGLFFALFAFLLIFFSKEGVFSLRWSQEMAYFYLFGSLPLLYLGWRALK